ncbi:MAG: hypothetical protein ABSD98_16815 [Candidatus Korobacteraceae bacterium]|jgi:hypothetical protein
MRYSFNRRFCCPISDRVTVMIVALLALGCSVPTLGQIVVTDRSGTKHILTECADTRDFYRSGTPFSGDIALDPGYKARIPQLSTFIALNFHTPKDQKRILETAIRRGRGGQYASDGLSNVILMVPMSSVDVITFGENKGKMNENGEVTFEQTSSIKVAGRPAFDGGTGYADLKCKEDLGPLGQAEFSAWVENLKEIRASGKPKNFRGDFNVFACNALPFKATVTDTSGQVIILDKAVYAQEGSVSRSRYPYMGDSEYSTVRCSSDLAVARSGTSHLSLSATKLRRIEVNKVNMGFNTGYSGFDAKVMLRSGGTFDLTITPENGFSVPSGILGATPDGWLWVPWNAVSVVEFQD